MAKKIEEVKPEIKQEEVTPEVQPAANEVDAHAELPILDKIPTQDEITPDPDVEFNVDSVKLSLKLARKHPLDVFRIGTLVVEGYLFKEYEMTEKQLEELMTEGCVHWLECKEHDLKAEFAKLKSK